MDKKARKDGASSPKPTKPTITIPEAKSTLSSATTALDSVFDTNSSRSATTAGTAPSAREGPDSATNTKSMNSTRSPEILALGELLGTMKRTLRALGTTFSLLGEQTKKVEALAPAIKAAEQIAELRQVLQAQMAEHEHKIKELERELEKKMKESLKGTLRDQALALVEESVAKRVQEAVEKQLKVQISDKLRQQANDHPRRISEIQGRIHNAEARSYNAALRSATDPLQPLLRPLPVPTDAKGLNSSPQVTDPTNALTPTASGIFPADLKTLFSLSASDAKRLLDEYGIRSTAVGKWAQSATVPVSPTSPQSVSSSGTVVEGSDDGRTREENINLFMAHIGLPYRLLPVPASASSSLVGQKLEYLITSVC